MLSLCLTLTLILAQTHPHKNQRMQDVAKQSLKEDTERLETSVKLHTWRTGIKKRALEHELQQQQVFVSY